MNHVNNNNNNYKSSTNNSVDINEKNSLLSNTTPNNDNNNNNNKIDEKKKLRDSFRLTAPRASPEISDICEINVNIPDTLITNNNNNSIIIDPVQNNNIINQNLSSNLINYDTVPASQLNASSNSNLVNNKVQKRKTDFNVNFNHNDVDDDDDKNNDEASSQNESEIDIESLANNIHDKNKRKRYLRKMKNRKAKLREKNKKESSNICCFIITKFRQAIKKILNTKFFVRGILGAILINTLSMGVEHHDQPVILTLIVEYSNYIFTTIFLIEMILKILGDGIFNYIKNAYNVFDGAIVAIR
jgi:hypothetical protein